jgi:hypothetical protein
MLCADRSRQYSGACHSAWHVTPRTEQLREPSGTGTLCEPKIALMRRVTIVGRRTMWIDWMRSERRIRMDWERTASV